MGGRGEVSKNPTLSSRTLHPAQWLLLAKVPGVRDNPAEAGVFFLGWDSAAFDTKIKGHHLGCHKHSAARVCVDIGLESLSQWRLDVDARNPPRENH